MYNYSVKIVINELGKQVDSRCKVYNASRQKNSGRQIFSRKKERDQGR